ncbi:S-layer homology domain-containing protein [Paenibacillus haidiansis]
MADKGYMKGYTNGTFKPKSNARMFPKR